MAENLLNFIVILMKVERYKNDAVNLQSHTLLIGSFVI